MRSYKSGITCLLAALLVFFIAGCGQETVTIPGVVSVTPAQGAANVLTNTTVTATFSMAMRAASLTPTTFTVADQSGADVTGTVAYSGLVATFTPTSGTLVPSTTYTATITTGAISVGGAPLVSNYVWTFTTIAPPPPPPTPPTVTVVPANGAAGVPVNQVLTATFNEVMNCATLNSTTFTLAGPGMTPVTGGTVNCSGNVATLALADSTLAYGTLYTATISTGAQNLAGQGVALTVWSFTTITPVPTVINTVPTDSSPGVQAVGVDPNKALTATFNEAMTPDTINSATFLLKATTSGTAVNGVITYVTAGSTATFAPIGGLAYNTQYTATITAGAENPALQTLANPYVWTFTTGAPSTSQPTVTSTIPVTPDPTAHTPVPEDVDVPLNQVISATFSEAMAPATIIAANFTLTVEGSNNALPGSLSYAAVGNSLVFVPTAPLLPSTKYTATITTGVTDLAGQQMASNYTWSFMTGKAVSTIAPELVLTVPANNAIHVPINQAVSATFSDRMIPLTLTSSTFQLFAGQDATGTPIAGTYRYDPVTFIATFTPTYPLAIGSFYTATVTNGAQSMAGIGLGTTPTSPATNPWTFETGTNMNQVPQLGPTIAAFAGFGGNAGMTNQGIHTVMHGDLGTTAASSLITGFHDDSVVTLGVPQCVYTEVPGADIGLVTGVIDTAPGSSQPTASCPNEGTAATMAIATEAASEALTAWNTLAAIPGGLDVSLCPGCGGGNAGELGNRTLAPGIYKSAPGSYNISAGPLTLDAKGDPNAYWVFQMASSLTVGAPTGPGVESVLLINGAKASNVFWQVGSAAVINYGGGGTMVGTIIAYSGVTISSPGVATSSVLTTLNGRAIGLDASVTVVNTVINTPLAP